MRIIALLCLALSAGCTDKLAQIDTSAKPTVHTVCNNYEKVSTAYTLATLFYSPPANVQKAVARAREHLGPLCADPDKSITQAALRVAMKRLAELQDAKVAVN